MKRFGEKLHALRSSQQMTLLELAKRLGYATHTYISEVEAGKKTPTAAFVLKVARLFDCTTDDLMKDERDITSLPLRNPKNLGEE